MDSSMWRYNCRHLGYNPEARKINQEIYAITQDGGPMAAPAPRHFSPTKTIRLGTITTSLLVLLGLTFIAISWGNIMSSQETGNSSVKGEAGQQGYDPAFLKILSEPSRPAPEPPASGLRKVVVQDLSMHSGESAPVEGPAGEY